MFDAMHVGPKRTVPLAVPNVGAREADAVAEAVRAGWVSSVGPQVDAFEAGLAAATGSQSAAAVAAGTMGLHLALVAVGVKHGDLVVCPSYTFAATANAICHAGAEPLFLDIDPISWTLDPKELAALLSESCEHGSSGLIYKPTGQRIAAVVPVYTNGMPADMDAINALLSPLGVPLIADAAAALGATYKGRALAGLADLTVFSFNGNKTITTGSGGAVVGRDEVLVKRVRHLATTARVGSGYDHDEVGYNYRMSSVEAVIGSVQLSRLGEFLAAKAAIKAAYDRAFQGSPGVGAFPDPVWGTSANWFSGIRVTAESGWTVPQLVEALNARGVMVRTFWKPMHLQPHFASKPRRSMRVTEAMWAEVLPLPCSTSIAAEELDYVIDAVRSLFKRQMAA